MKEMSAGSRPLARVTRWVCEKNRNKICHAHFCHNLNVTCTVKSKDDPKIGCFYIIQIIAQSNRSHNGQRLAKSGHTASDSNYSALLLKFSQRSKLRFWFDGAWLWLASHLKRPLLQIHNYVKQCLPEKVPRHGGLLNPALPLYLHTCTYMCTYLGSSTGWHKPNWKKL
jgi:hypothetical protein